MCALVRVFQNLLICGGFYTQTAVVSLKKRKKEKRTGGNNKSQSKCVTVGSLKTRASLSILATHIQPTLTSLYHLPMATFSV